MSRLSTYRNKKAGPYLALLLFCVPMFFINVHDTHSFGDDWTQYLQEGLNIAQGKPYYQSGYIFNPQNVQYAPPQYPPGYPLLLAPVVAFTGKSIIALTIFNAFLVSILMFTAFFFFKKYTSRFTAVCLAVILGYLSAIIDLKGQILSDIPCLLFSLLYLAIRKDGQPNGMKRSIALILTGTFALLIRSQAVVLVFTEAMIGFYWLLHIRKSGRPAMLLFRSAFIVCAGISVLFALFNFVVFAAPESTLGFYGNLYQQAFEHQVPTEFLKKNTIFLYDFVREVFYQPVNDPLLQVLISIVSASMPVVAVIGGLVMLREKRGRFGMLFLLWMCILILVTPVWQGIRYFLPGIPVFILLVAKGIKWLTPLLGSPSFKKIAVAAVVLFLASGYDHAERATRAADWGPSQTDFDAFDYVRKNVPDKGIIIFSKPRLLCLYSGKSSMNISWNIDATANRKQFDSMQVSYLLDCSHLSLDIIDSFKKLTPSPCIDSVKINEAYTLYRLDSAPK